MYVYSPVPWSTPVTDKTTVLHAWSLAGYTSKHRQVPAMTKQNQERRNETQKYIYRDSMPWASSVFALQYIDTPGEQWTSKDVMFDATLIRVRGEMQRLITG